MWGGAAGVFGLSASGCPVFQMQAWHLDKFAGVVVDQRCLLAEGAGGDHGVEPSWLGVNADPAGLPAIASCRY